MAFQIGDRIQYTNRNHGKAYKITGEIVGTYWYNDGDWVVKVDDDCSSRYHWTCGRHIYRQGLGGASQHCPQSVLVPRRSRNLLPGIRAYDPSQNGDTDDDI